MGDRSTSTAGAISASVLVLNKYYSAVRVVNARRAFTLLYKNSAEAIDMENQSFRNYDFESWVSESERKEAVGAPQCEYVRAPRFRVLVPKVIRLVTYDRMPMREVKFTRKNILARDGNRCQYCGKRASPSKLTIDHVIPKSRRGETVWNNVVTACHKCNAKKGNRTPAESGMKLLKKPEAPKKNPIVDEKMRTERYEVWRQFLTCQRIPPEM